MTLSNKYYDILKWAAQILLPAFGTLYFALAGIWGLPYAEQVVGTITAIDTFLGVLLGISSASYAGDGDMVVTETEDKVKYSFELNYNPEELKNKETLTFRVRS